MLRRGLAALVCAQGAGLLFAALFLFVRGAAGGAYDSGSARLGAAMALFGAVTLVMLAWATWRRRKWATSPLVVAELLAVPVAVSLLQAAQPGYGVPLLVSAVVALVLVAASGMLTARRPPPAPADPPSPPDPADPADQADQADQADPGPSANPAPAPSGAGRRPQPRKRRR